MNKETKILCILQLCIAFSVLLWIILSPFTETYYSNKKLAQELDWVIVENAEYFQDLPPQTRKKISELESKVERQSNETFPKKLKQSIEALLIYTPFYKKNLVTWSTSPPYFSSQTKGRISPTLLDTACSFLTLCSAILPFCSTKDPIPHRKLFGNSLHKTIRQRDYGRTKTSFRNRVEILHCCRVV